ncbi:MAG: hypothetical protein H6626_13040 [Pseudobdellovibrionaceae bacterium]|nr:hypothetical protein [Bdellovibrionales bacterium]USN47100.1 MAG: hypothetical protein H6626_13040 [Pseudobdellovibrionaceae bacterium]
MDGENAAPSPALYNGDGTYVGKVLKESGDFTVFMDDGAFLVITPNQGLTTDHFKYLSTDLSSKFYIHRIPSGLSYICLYNNTVCSGSCGRYERPPRNSLTFHNDDTGARVWYKWMGDESSFTRDGVTNASYRDETGACQIEADGGNTATYYIPYQTYTIPPVIESLSNVYLGVK